MPRPARALLTACLVAVDSIAALLAFLLAFHLSQRFGLAGGDRGGFTLIPLAIVVPFWVGLFAVNRLYVHDEIFEGSLEYARIAHACTLAVLSLIVLGFWGRSLRVVAPSREFVLLVWGSGLLSAGFARFGVRRIVRLLRRRGYLVTRVVIVGLGAQGIHLARHYHELPAAGVRVVGFVDDFAPPGTPVFNGLKVLGPPTALARIIAQAGATEVITLPSAVAWESFQDLVRASSLATGYKLRLAGGYREIVATSMRVHQRGAVPLLTIERVRITGLDAILKMGMDLVLTIVLSPLWGAGVAAGAALLLLARRRPLVTDEVVGLRGRAFRMWRLNVQPNRGRLDRFIWQSGLERLPAMINVLRGQLSLVGPRPIRVDERVQFAAWMPNLMTVKPGVTGPWFVQGGGHDVQIEMEMVAYYIRNHTIWLDLEMLARSVGRLLWHGRRTQARGTEGEVDGGHFGILQFGAGDPQPAESRRSAGYP